MTESRPGDRLMLGLLAGLVALWGVLGWLDIGSRAQAGFSLDSHNTVRAVDAGSPAERAGMLPGDEVLTIAGFKAGDTRSLARLPRPRAGDSRVITLMRDDVPHTLQIAYAPPPAEQQARERSSVVLGFCFLLFPLLALWRRATDATRVLAFMGIGLSLAILDGPYIIDAGARALAAAITSLFAVCGVAAVVQFLLVFPRRRAFLGHAWGKTLLYLPALLLWLLLAWRILLAPPATELLNRFSGLLLGMVEGGYFLVALFLLLHNYSKTDRAQRKRLALNLMLWCTIAGLLPAVIGQLAAVFSPASQLPGQDYYFMSLLLVPLGWAWSASRPA